MEGTNPVAGNEQAVSEQNVSEQAVANNEANQATQPQAEENNSTNVLTEELGQSEVDAQSKATAQEEKTLDPQDQVPEGDYKFFDESGNEVSAEEAAGFQSAFKEAHLTSRQAQILKTAYDKSVSEGLSQQIENTSKQWRQEVERDKELGGANLATTKLNLGRAIDVCGSPELRQFLKESRLGNNPHMVRFINNVGKMIGEDRFVGGNSGAGNRKDPIAEAKRLYPNSPKLWGGI